MNVADNAKFRKLYVGNLDMSVTEELLIALFGQLGSIKNCKIIHEPGTDPYAFIEFADHQAAAAALLAMNKRLCLGKEMKVNWATSTGYVVEPKPTGRPIQGNYHIFVGDLAPEIESQQLRDAFAPFGEISDVKIMRFPDTHKPKGYGFVSFANRTVCGVTTGYFHSKCFEGRRERHFKYERTVVRNEEDSHQLGDKEDSSRKLSYDEVWQWTSETNSSVYCGGIFDTITENLPCGELRKLERWIHEFLFDRKLKSRINEKDGYQLLLGELTSNKSIVPTTSVYSPQFASLQAMLQSHVQNEEFIQELEA